MPSLGIALRILAKSFARLVRPDARSGIRAARDSMGRQDRPVSCHNPPLSGLAGPSLVGGETGMRSLNGLWVPRFTQSGVAVFGVAGVGKSAPLASARSAEESSAAEFGDGGQRLPRGRTSAAPKVTPCRIPIEEPAGNDS